MAALFGEADKALGFPISKLCFEGPEEELKLTENTQPALLTTAVGAFRVLSERGVVPDFVAGHSLGEYSALVAAGSLDFSSAVSLVRNRGRYMQEAVPVGEGAMAAILGLDSEEVRSVCERVQESEVVTPANFNSLTQIVIAGHRPAVERVRVHAREERLGLIATVSGQPIEVEPVGVELALAGRYQRGRLRVVFDLVERCVPGCNRIGIEAVLAVAQA